MLERARHDARHERGIVDRRKLHQPHALREVRQLPCSHVDREPRLAHAASPRQCHQRVRRKKREQMVTIRRAANQRRELPRQIGGTKVLGAQRRKVCREPGTLT